MRRSADETLLSLSELAAEVGVVSASALRNWTRMPDEPLRRSPSSGSGVLTSWAHLHAFCAAHPDLPGVRRITRRLPPQPDGLTASATTHDPEQVRASIRNLRTVAASNLAAALSAARTAESVATAHREQLELLSTSLNAYDDLITQLTELTTPSTRHD